MRTLLRTAAVAAAGLLAAMTAIAPASAVPPALDGSTPSITPVIDKNFADPDFLLVDGVYHAYATNSGGDNVQHMTSKNLKNWKPEADVLPVLGDWVGECSFAPGGSTDHCIWAPEVTAVEGGYALYYTARDEASGRQCIGLATSESPYGPFVDTRGTPLICPVDQGGAIDAATYYEDGQFYLLWKSDGNCCRLPAIIYIQKVSADGTTLTSEPVEIARNDQPWEGAVVEGPTLIKHDGTYYLFYSANDFGAGNYKTGYATATNVMGPYTDATEPLLTTTLFGGDVIGPGGQDVVQRKDGSYVIFFHGWNDLIQYRGVYMSELTFDADGDPVVAGTSTRYEAEDGVNTNARIVDDNAASGGQKVGGMDFADSSVTVRVWADKTGQQTIGIRYDNGTTDGARRLEATDRLTVNGQDLGLVTLEHTTWGNWATVERRVKLTKGWNTVTVTRVSGFAEIDHIDVYPTKPDPVLELTPTQPGDQVLPGATRYEAEDGVVTHARVRAAADGSGGAVVGGLDFADSSITVRVWADDAGSHTLGIRYANGSERGGFFLDASHFVTVNGEDAGILFFPPTRWGNWQTIEYEVELEEGWNDVTLTRRGFYAEIDYIDVVAN